MSEEIFLKMLSGLNSEQKKAVEAIEGPVMVLAGPGTGKTQILALRIANILVKTDVNPSNILALTFTEVGARAMRERLITIIGADAYDVAISTFHSFCSRVIEEFPHKFSFRNELRPIDDIARYEIIRNILERSSFNYVSNPKNRFKDVRKILDGIKNIKDESFSEEDMHQYLIRSWKEHKAFTVPENATKKVIREYGARHEELLMLEEFLIVYKEYQDYLRENGLFDFADMIQFVIDRFKKDNDLLLHYQEQYQYILADEFQDSNGSQIELLKLMSQYFEEYPNVFVVGDDDQSIYRFQGASLLNFNSFLEEYEKSTMITLKQNYRSSQLILDASKSVISNNKFRIDSSKSLESNVKILDEKVIINEFSTQIEEFNFLAKEIVRLKEDGVDYSEMAVICRTNSELELIADFFQGFSIPYSLSTNANVLANKYIIKVISILRLISDPDNFVEFHKALFLPSLDISVDVMVKVNNLIKKNKYETVFDLPMDIDENLSSFLNVLRKYYAEFEVEPVAKVFVSFLEEIRLIEYLGLSLERLEDFSILNDFIGFVNSSSLQNLDFSIGKLLNAIDAISEHNLKLSSKETLSSSNSVSLMTAHKSKGLEFEYVFIPYCIQSKWSKFKNNSSFIPSDLIIPKDESKADKEEEARRLFYVALTRAKKLVQISFSLNYESASSTQELSKFAAEIDQKFIERIKHEPLTQEGLTKLYLSKPKPNYFKDKELNKIKELVKNNFVLTATALNNFIYCKRQFFLQNILKVPQAQVYAMIRGTLVHLLIQSFLAEKSFSVSQVEEVISKFLAKQLLKQSDKEHLAVEAKELFMDWYEFHKANGSLIVPLFSEYSFENKDLFFDGVPIRGKIDVIEELNGPEKLVRVIDYKTGKVLSQNAVLGNVSTSDKKMYYQLMFYKLLIESDQKLKLNAIQGGISFIEPTGSGNFSNVFIDFNEEDYSEFKNLVKQSYQQILNLEFLNFEEKCSCYNCNYNYL